MEEITIYRVESDGHRIVSKFFLDINDAKAELETMRKTYPNSRFEIKPYSLWRRFTLS